MGSGAKRIWCWCWCGAVLMLAVAIYSLMGILQAVSLYEGERALRNFRLWGAVILSSLFASAILVFSRHAPGSRDVNGHKQPVVTTGFEFNSRRIETIL